MNEAMGEGPRSADILEENRLLRQELERLVRTAAANEKIWRHMVEIERVLFRTREFDRLASELLKEIRARFDVDGVALIITHPDVVDRFFPQLLNGGGCRSLLNEGGTCVLALTENPSRQELMDKATSPVLLRGEEALRPILAHLPSFPEEFAPVGSAALVPLTVHDLSYGFLLLASADPDHYRPGDGTELLEQMGVKIALCMDNCLAYERVKDLSDRDGPTGLLNFFQIHNVLEREFRRARRRHTDLSVLAVDLEFVDEGAEHEDMVDPVLRHVGELMRSTFPDGDGFIGRYGSVEFLVVCPYADEKEAHTLAVKLHELIRRSPLRHRRTVILIKPRIGTATLTPAMHKPHELLDAAHKALCVLKTSQGFPRPLTEAAGQSSPQEC
jgi:diguanylate cyclase (GGDEF)-like protein